MKAVVDGLLAGFDDVLGRTEVGRADAEIDDAAALFGVSVDALSRLETGNGGVRLETLLKVLDGLGLALLTAEKASTTVLTLQRLRDQQD